MTCYSLGFSRVLKVNDYLLNKGAAKKTHLVLNLMGFVLIDRLY
jgi:hypothetical protein